MTHKLKKQRLLWALLAASVLVVTLAGDGGGEEDGADGVTRLQFWHAMGGPLGDALDALVAEFNESHSLIEIQSISMGRYQALSQKIMASVAANQPPDLAQVYEAWTENLVENGSAESLSPYVNGPNGLSQDELDDFIPGMIANSTWNGEIYSFPFNKSVRALYWNKGAFAEVGLTRAPTN
ncbi:extracellular solute-binding protein, partial [bacterium]|nr:extracellular solute-binding protein [bacterium]